MRNPKLEPRPGDVLRGTAPSGRYEGKTIKRHVVSVRLDGDTARNIRFKVEHAGKLGHSMHAWITRWQRECRAGRFRVVKRAPD